MPIAAILSVGRDHLEYQWYSEGGQVRHEGSLRWSEIKEVRVFKRDMFTYDLICMAIVADNGPAIEVDEEDPNWGSLTDAIHIHLPGAARWGDWFCEVAFPAFATREKIIFTKTPPQP